MSEETEQIKDPLYPLLEKYMVMHYLLDTRQRLIESRKVDKKIAEVIYLIDEIADEAGSCIVDWSGVSSLYSRASCILGFAVPFLANGDCEEVRARIDSLDAAHFAAKPFVLDHLQGNADEQKLRELGF